MKKLIALSYFSFLISYSLFSQSVGIGTNTPNASALLDVTATNKGVLVPRVTNAQMIAIASPANGLLVYNTDSSAFAYRNATTWVFIKGNATASNDWSTKGNAGTDPAKNFIGTTDTVGLRFRIKNTNAGTLDSLTRNTAFGFRVLDSASTTVPGQFNTAFGYKVLLNNNTGRSNTGIGANALQQTRSGSSNVAVGNSAMGFNKTGNHNVAAGDRALFTHTEGDDNVAIGYLSLVNDSIGAANTAAGAYSMGNNISGSNNAAFGYNALTSNTTGSGNVAIGHQSLLFHNAGNNNVAVGASALLSDSIGAANTAIGTNALGLNISGASNAAIGFNALRNNRTGNNNIAMGDGALYSHQSGNDNTAIGTLALFSNTSGFSNVAIGTGSLNQNTNRSNLVAIGDSALFYNGTGTANPDEATANTAVGSKALYANSKGYLNTAIGYTAMLNSNVGDSNVAVGSWALRENSGGSNNVAIGIGTLFNNFNGTGNTAIGSVALGANLGGSYNTAVGSDAGRQSIGGSYNVFIGNLAGYSSSGSNKLYISNSASNADNTLIYGEFDNKLVRSNGRMEINSDNTLNEGLRVIKNYAAGTNSNLKAIYGENIVDNNWGIGVEGKGGRTGVQGFSQGNGSLTYAGVKGVADGDNIGVNLGLWGQASGSAFINRAVAGEANGSSGEKFGVYGSATGGGINYAVYGIATGGSTNYAGYFAGNVFANGKLTVSTAAGNTGLDLAGSDAYAEMRVIRNTLSTTDKDLYFGFSGPVGSSIHLYSDGFETMTVKNNSVGVGKIPLNGPNDSRLMVKQISNLTGIGVEAENSTNHWDFYTTFSAESNFNLYYNGTFKGAFNNITGAYTAGSDRRMKKDITLQQPVLNNVMQLQAYQYHYLDNKPTDNFSNGFMAQDVQKIFPDAVVENTMKDGEKRLGINYQYFTVLAIKGMQEQQQQIQSQEERIAKLEAIVKTLVDKK